MSPAHVDHSRRLFGDWSADAASLERSLEFHAEQAALAANAADVHDVDDAKEVTGRILEPHVIGDRLVLDFEHAEVRVAPIADEPAEPVQVRMSLIFPVVSGAALLQLRPPAGWPRRRRVYGRIAEHAVWIEEAFDGTTTTEEQLERWQACEENNLRAIVGCVNDAIARSEFRMREAVIMIIAGRLGDESRP